MNSITEDETKLRHPDEWVQPQPSPDVAALIAMIELAVTDWDGSQEVDGAEPVRIPSCGQLRAIAAELTRLAAENQRFKELIKSETAWLRSLGPKESDEGNGEEIENALIKAKAEVDRLRSGITPNVSREYSDTGEKPSPLQAIADILKPFTFKGVKPDTGETP